jgi:hypothetical protein
MASPYRLSIDVSWVVFPAANSCCEECAREIVAAEREMGAFVVAIRELFGEMAGAKAAEFWVEAAENVDDPFMHCSSRWRYISMIAASRLASEHFHLPSLSKKFEP